MTSAKASHNQAAKTFASVQATPPLSSMAAPHLSRAELEFAVALVEEHLGDECSLVLQQLLRKGAHSLRELVHCTALQHERAREALLSLVKQNCVYASSELPSSTSKRRAATDASQQCTRVLYEASPKHALTRLRFSRFLSTVHSIVGTDGRQLLCSIIEHGRASINELLRICGHDSAHCGDGDGAAFATDGQGDAAAAAAAAAMTVNGDLPKGRESRLTVDGSIEIRERQRTETEVCRLIHERLIERAPPSQLLRLPWPSESVHAEESGQRKKNWKSLPFLGQSYAVAADERRAKVQWDNWDRCRFLPPKDIEHLMPPRSRHHQPGDMTSNEPGHVPDSEAEWRINVDELHKRLRHIECHRHFDEISTLGEDEKVCCQEVLSGVLDTGSETVLQSETNPFPDTALQERLAEECAEEPPSLDTIRSHMKKVTYETCGLVQQSSREDGSVEYVVNLKQTLDERRRCELEQAVLIRFGQNAKRIFRMLRLRGPHQDKEIAKECMIEIQQARERLYKMLQFGFLELQEVSKAQDHTPSRTYFIYRVNFKRALDVYRDSVFKTCHNLLLRLKSERELHKEALEHVGDDEACAMHQFNSKQRSRRSVTKNHQQAVQEYKQRAELLWDRLLSYENSLMLFHDI